MQQYLNPNAFTQLAFANIKTLEGQITHFFQNTDAHLFSVTAEQRKHLNFLRELSEHRFETLLWQQGLNNNASVQKELMLIAFFIAYQIRLDKIEGKKESRQSLTQSLEKCQNLALALGLNINWGMLGQLQPLEQATGFFSMPGKTQAIKSGIGQINMTRLYWVFASSWTNSVADTFSPFASTRNITALPGFLPGRLSWGLYFSRLGIELGLLVKHTVKNSSMLAGEKEADLTFAQRFDVQWQQRKYVILNDLVWAPINALCYFTLVGPGRLGQIGNIVSIVAFMYDALIQAIKYEEKRAELEQTRLVLVNARDDLRQALQQAQVQQEDTAELTYLLTQAEYELQQFDIKQRYETEALVNELIYSLVLVMGITLMSGFGLPLTMFTPEAMNLCVLVGASLCFGGNLLSSVYASVLKYQYEEERLDAQNAHRTTLTGAPWHFFNVQKEEHLHKIAQQEIKNNLMSALVPVLMLTLGATCAPLVAQSLFVATVLAYKYFNQPQEEPVFHLPGINLEA